MANIITRETVGLGATVKGSPLNNNEVDTNFINLNADLSTSDYVVDNIAALKAVDSTIHTSVSTRGYYDVVGVGAGTYWYDSTDTTSVDNGGTVIVATDGARWKLIHNYILDVAQFGACTGTDDLVYITAALAWADTVLTAGTVPSITLSSHQQLYTSNTITHPGNDELNLLFYGGVTTATSWIGLDSDPIVVLRGASTSHILGDVDCKNVCNGIDYSGYRLKLSETSVYHGKYWQVTGGGECQLTVNVNQWLKTDPEFLNKANFTAYGFYVDGSDTVFLDCTAALCLYPVYLAPTSKANAFLNCHFWQGTGGGPGPVPVDPVVVVNESNSYNYMYNCYFDNGYVIMNKAGLYIQGGQYTDNGLSTITQPYIRYYCATNGISPITALVKNIKASVGFYNDGANIYPGDYTAINASTVDISKGDICNVARYEFNICPNQGNSPARRHLKPIDDWVDTWQIGAGSVLKWIYDTTKATLDAVGGLLIKDGSTSLGKLTFGNGDVGVGETTNNILSFYTFAGGEVWQMVSAGHINPLTDATLDIGSTTNSRRIKNLHAKNTILSPWIGETSPTNGTLWFDWVDDSHFKIKQRGYDGVLRSVTLTTS